MTALVFLLAIAVVFGAILALEVREPDTTPTRRPLGIIAWLTGGNWPAKIGGGLLVVGVGSLLRYALINYDVAPAIKLGTGVVGAGLLALAATLTRMGSARRAVSLALGGAAFGVAYLTAYSAFALFGYIPSVTGIGLLALTAIGAGAYAVTRSALSLAVLAMVGAFLAPAFAVNDPGPAIVYGYYAAASLLTLAMVAARGWRALIQLSFLFTLAGGVFFAWTARYFSPAYADVMLPAIIVLAAIHVAMPLVERHGARNGWLERLDLIYLLALPAVAALAAVLIAPSRTALANELLALGALWLLGAVYLWLAKREGAVQHAVIGVLLAGLGVAARFRDLPWELIALAFAVGALWIAARCSTSARLHSTLAGLVPLLGMLHVLTSLSPNPGSPVFVNGRFLERLIGAGLLMLAGHICRSIRQSLDTLLWSVGIGWAVIVIGAELVRWDLVSLALVIHWASLALAVTLALVTVRSAAVANALIAVPLVVVLSASWAATGAAPSVSWLSLVAAPVALMWMAVRRAGADSATRGGQLLSAVMAPLAAAIWAMHVASLAGIHAPQFPLTLAAAAVLLMLVAGYLLPGRSAAWMRAYAEMCGIAFAIVLLVATTIAIGRSPWAVALECLSLGGLLWLALIVYQRIDIPRWVGPLAALGTGLLLQANLLRWLGPAGDLDLLDIARMRFPAVVSLLWAVMGGVLTLWGRRQASRPVWVAGASLLVAAAVKLVLVDFGSLGQLTNILAVIAAGIVFMLVGWLAPMPPARAPAPGAGRPSSVAPAGASVAAAAVIASPARAASAPAPETVSPPTGNESASSNEYWDRNANARNRATPAGPEDDSGRKIAWIIAILAGMVLPLAQCSHATRDLIRHTLGFGNPAAAVSAQAVPAAQIAATAPPAGAATVTPMRAEPLALPVVETECSQWAAQLPADYVVYAAGDYKGSTLDFVIDDSNHRAGRFDVLVNEPGRNVVLVLGAYEPSIWNLKWSAATHIAGVWLSGYYAAKITGLESTTPLLRSSYKTGGACPYFYVADQQVSAVAQAVNQVLGRGIQKLVVASEGRIAIGRTEETPYYTQGDTRPVESFRDMSQPLAGDKGIEDLLRSGQLRRATMVDYQAWLAASGGQAPQIPVHSLGNGGELFRTYVVLQAMNIPADLYGANLVTLIVPRGVPRPQGSPGHSEILDMNR